MFCNQMISLEKVIVSTSSHSINGLQKCTIMWIMASYQKCRPTVIQYKQVTEVSIYRYDSSIL